MPLYEKAIDEGILPFFKGILLNSEDLLRKDVIMGLMSNFRVDIKRIESKFNINFLNILQKV